MSAGGLFSGSLFRSPVGALDGEKSPLCGRSCWGLARFRPRQGPPASSPVLACGGTLRLSLPGPSCSSPHDPPVKMGGKFMKKSLIFTASLFPFLWLFATLAFPQPREWGPYPMMGWSWMWGSMGIGMMLFMLIFWVLIIAGAVALIRWLWSGPSGSISPIRRGESAEEILRKRYARGEIEKEEFEEKLRILKN